MRLTAGKHLNYMNARNLTINDLEPLFARVGSTTPREMAKYLRLSLIVMRRYASQAKTPKELSGHYRITRQQAREIIRLMLEKEAHAA